MKLFFESFLAVAQPLTWRYVHAEMHYSFASMELPPNRYILKSPEGGDIAEIRQKMAEKAVVDGASHLLWIDADMIFPEDMVVRMFKVMETTDAKMVGVVCYRGYPPYDPLIWHPVDSDRLMRPFTDFQFGDIVDASKVGCAALLVDTDVFHGLPKPWFQIEEITETSSDEIRKVIKRGEDTYFTRNATSAGFPLKVITEVDVGHLRDFCVDRHMWLLFALAKKLGWEGVAELLQRE